MDISITGKPWLERIVLKIIMSKISRFRNFVKIYLGGKILRCEDLGRRVVFTPLRPQLHVKNNNLSPSSLKKSLYQLYFDTEIFSNEFFLKKILT